ncbi:MAG: glycosyltransferase [Alphaproteobacteria bacterium]|jgi:sucrose-phosphate synthase|nr:glycosyltransferase [Alphaproteobacteria bacterium]
MHVIFLNPQGNFDAADSHLAEHPDFGGQLVYVKEVAQAMAGLGHKVDIVTRRIEDPAWPEFAAEVDGYPGFEGNPRILRFSCGGPDFLNKERLWPHIAEFVANVLAFYGDGLPDFATAHYADGGYCAVLAQHLAGIGFTFTGHSLGAQKLDKLGTSLENLDDMETRFRFSRRIAAERLSMARAARIVTSTGQERREQYAHPLYAGAIDADDAARFAVIPPGVNERVFTTQAGARDGAVHGALDAVMGGDAGPAILVSGRLDEKKNIIGVVRAYAGSEKLRERAELVLCVRGIDDPFVEIGKLVAPEQAVLRPVLDAIADAGIRDSVRFLNIPSQDDLAATYRYFAGRGSLFALTSFYEPFGLAPIEAAACGLAPVVTRNGGPSEIFADGSGVLVDPFDPDDIARGLLHALDDYSRLSAKAVRRVAEAYTWHGTAEAYLAVIEAEIKDGPFAWGAPQELDDGRRIRDYLKKG